MQVGVSQSQPPGMVQGLDRVVVPFDPIDMGDLGFCRYNARNAVLVGRSPARMPPPNKMLELACKHLA